MYAHLITSGIRYPIKFRIGGGTRCKLIPVGMKLLDEASPCGGWLEYLHRSPASRRRRQKGSPVPGGYKYRGLALQVGGSVRYGHESRGTRTRGWMRWWGSATVANNRPILSPERAPHINKPETVWLLKMWTWASDRGLTPRQTGRPWLWWRCHSNSDYIASGDWMSANTSKEMERTCRRAAVKPASKDWQNHEILQP
jgi:hypothetical protein